MNIINKSFKINIDNIKSVLDGIFPNLNYKDKIIIIDYTTQIIKYIACRFCFDLEEEEIYYKQFNKNNFRDIKSVINLLLPYIDDVNGTYVLHQQVTTLSDIAKPNITNINYDRSLNDDEIYRFSEIDLYINYKLILDTLNVSSNKLYINWLNCLPYTLTKYKESLLWKQSYYFDINKNKFNFIDKDIKDLRCDFDYYGIHIYDIYNCCNQFLFQHILPIKWLLYEKLLHKGDKPLMYIKELTNFFNLELLLNNKKWELLSDYEKSNIYENWNNLISSASRSNSNSDSDTGIFNIIHLGIVKQIILHYESYSEYKIFSQKIYNEDEDEDKDKKRIDSKIISNDYSVNIKDDKNITAEEFIQLVNDNYSIDIIYNYLIILINDFNKTWYGKKIIKNNKIIELDIKLNNITSDTFYLTYKNIYNFAKRICYNNFKYITEARCLDDKTLKEFIENINGVPIFTNVLRLTYKKKYSDSEINTLLPDILNNISLEIKKILMEIVFESHIIYGLLCKFTPESNITPIYNDDYVRDFKNSYYFLTNDKYKNLSCYHNNKIINYFDFLKTDEKLHWYKAFALDWIYQIQFYHRFLNNRLIYVTGATGQGKSTQIPKLLYYATKAFCLVMNPKVISTQPRILPTKENANRISLEMGVPIEVSEGINTFLDYIQYNTKEYKHKYDSKTYIREVIDKILYDELLKEPLLENKYNVIIVDEAHEHNINMDLILTLMKSTLYFNNKIRFIITSATIQYDESRYRTYYRHIDDNLLFPCNLNLLNNELDRIVIDRRTHISPPGETTRFKVIENWEEKDPKDYKEAEKIGIKRAIEIAKNNDGKGDVLFFSIGESEIKNICKELNEKLPSHAIALPFYANLPESWKIIAKKPDERKNKLNFDKIKLFDIINGETVEESIVNYNYTTVFIVATNIAEASITIGGLNFVIDTGYSKKMPFDIITNIKEAGKPSPITEMNRIQRKGRIGRISDGTIYYTYSENFLKNIEPDYSIKNSDFTINVFKLLTSEEDYIDEFLIDENKLIMKTKKKYIEFDKEKDYNDNISKIYFFKNNYKYYDIREKKKKWFNPQGNKNIRNFDVLKVPRRYIDGKFSFKDIKDEDKEFYLIHPDKIDAYYQNCKNKKYILTTSDKKDIKNNYIQKILDVTIFFGEIFGQDEDESIPMINTLIHSIAYKCLDDVVKILIWLKIIKLDLSKIFNNFNKAKKIIKQSDYSDLLVLLSLEDMFVFDHENTIKDITPKKKELQLFIDWMNNSDNNKWFEIPNEYKKIYEYLFNKNTELGEMQFNLKFKNIKNIIKDDLIIKYIENYKKMKFSLNDEYIDNKLLENNNLINGYKIIKELAIELSINKTEIKNHNILKSFFSGYNNNILSCNNKNWIINKEIYNPHFSHFLSNVNGMYFAIGLLNKFDKLQPMILSKIINDEWINEIKS
jgi:hypothetical protein